MAVTDAALADLQFGLRFAADRYRSFAEMDFPGDNAGLFMALASEREDDADDIDRASVRSATAPAAAAISDDTAGPMLGMGEGDPYNAASAAYRVQRAENTLGRMAAQLRSLSRRGQVRDVLERIGEHIDRRREDVQEARRRARGGRLAHGVARMRDIAADGQQVQIWFATNRRRGTRGEFPGERAASITHGRCSVFVPDDRPLGSLGRGPIGRILKGDNRIRLLGTDVLGEQQFWSLLARELSAMPAQDQQGLIFLHGFNTKFEDAARRTAQLKVDLGHKGPAAFFSWPSLGFYTGDEAAIEGSEAAIRKFLVDFATLSGANAVHIIAHSMGNRGLLRAMDAIAGAAASSAPVRFGQVFLAAPDVDAQLFQNLASAYGQLSARTTLYVTNNDRAIGLSRRLHHFARVGLSPPVAVVPGIDTIDASDVNLGMLGHSYAAEMRPVLTDIHSLIQADAAPDRRFGLRRALRGKAAHWEFIP